MSTDIVLAVAIGLLAPLLVLVAYRRASRDIDLTALAQAAVSTLRRVTSRAARTPEAGGETAVDAPRPGMLRRLKVDRPLANGHSSAAIPPRDRRPYMRRGLEAVAAGSRRINRRSSRDEAPTTDGGAAADSQPVVRVARDFRSTRVRPEAAITTTGVVESASPRRQSGMTLYITGDTLARVHGWLGREPNTFEHIMFRALFGLARIGGRGRAADVPVPAWPAGDPVAPNGYIRLDPGGECPRCAVSASRGAHFCQACGRRLSASAAPATMAAPVAPTAPAPVASPTMAAADPPAAAPASPATDPPAMSPPTPATDLPAASPDTPATDAPGVIQTGGKAKVLGNSRVAGGSPRSVRRARKGEGAGAPATQRSRRPDARSKRPRA